MAQAIQDAGWDVVLVEPGLAGVRNAVRRGIRQVVHATLADAGIRAERLPAVGLFDVVEHIGDDAGFLRGVHHLLVPGGRVYLTVPAYQWLWSGEDDVAGHARRYTVAGLSAVLEGAGFEVEYATYFFGFLPLPILLRRTLPYRLGLAAKKVDEAAVRADHTTKSAWVDRVLRILTDRELAKIARGRRLRMGGSCLAVARKRR